MATRRAFLKASALALYGVGTAPAWLGRAVGATPEGGRKKTLVVIFQRGAADGLNIVVPHGEPRYYALRPNIAIPQNLVVDLDGRFGLHPNLANLQPLWERKQLAIVEAVGSPDPTRSHFDAQDYMESGTPGRKSTRDGWLNRALLAERAASPVRAVALGAQMPRALQGGNRAVNIANIGQFSVKDAMSGGTFEELYAASVDTVLKGTAKETFDAVKLLESVQKSAYVPANGARYPNGRLGQSLQQIARLIKADVGLEVAFADLGGWDHHVNEVGPNPRQGVLANLLNEYGGSLAAFTQDLGERLDDVLIVTMSEFGRTARENGNRGTDHGHANQMFVIGGGVKGGKVYGDWPGLEREQLYEGRDLALTTDFRDVLAEVVAKQVGNTKADVVFPGYRVQKRLGLL